MTDAAIRFVWISLCQDQEFYSTQLQYNFHNLRTPQSFFPFEFAKLKGLKLHSGVTRQKVCANLGEIWVIQSFQATRAERLPVLKIQRLRSSTCTRAGTLQYCSWQFIT